MKYENIRGLRRIQSIGAWVGKVGALSFVTLKRCWERNSEDKFQLIWVIENEWYKRDISSAAISEKSLRDITKIVICKVNQKIFSNFQNIKYPANFLIMSIPNIRQGVSDIDILYWVVVYVFLVKKSTLTLNQWILSISLYMGVHMV